MKRSGDSTHHSPTPTLNDFDFTLSTGTQSSEQKYSYLTASKRHPSTPYSRNTPESFSRRTRPYIFPRSTKNVYTSLACSQDFLKILLENGNLFCSATAATKSGWVSPSIGSNIFAASWHTLFLGGYAKRCPGSWFIHSCLPFCLWG